jgi:16S rRNA processing protein RimM
MQPFLEPAQLPADAIEVGRIQDAWGIKGGFKVIPYSASPEALFSSKRWFLLPPEPRPGVAIKPKANSFTGCQLLRIRTAKEHGDGITVQADGVDDRTTAETLKGARIFVPRSSFPTPDPDEFYWIDLIGLNVVNREGLELGAVTSLLETGPQTVLVIHREGHVDDKGKAVEIMIPFVAAYVDEVKLADKRITVDWQLDY